MPGTARLPPALQQLLGRGEFVFAFLACALSDDADATVVVAIRTYVTVDIILKTLREYFGVHAWHVLNITDVDDKIIKRARSPLLSPCLYFALATGV
jgi:hypothetical protein